MDGKDRKPQLTKQQRKLLKKSGQQAKGKDAAGAAGGGGGGGGEDGSQEPRPSTSGGAAGGSGRQRLSQDESAALAQEMRGKLVLKKEGKFVKRPGYGTKTESNRIRLISNHFKLTFSNIQIIHYDVNIEPGARRGAAAGDAEVSAAPPETQKKFRKLSYKINRLVIDTMIRSNKQPGQAFHGLEAVYDGVKNLYTRYPIEGVGSEPTGGKRFEVDIEEHGSHSLFYVSIKFAVVVQLNALTAYFGDRQGDTPFPQEAIQALDIILRHGPTYHNVPIGPSIYSHSQAGRIDIGGGRSLAFGHYQSVRPTECGATLVVDRSVTAFFSALTIPLFIERFFGLNEKKQTLRSVPEISDSNRKQLERELKGLQVVSDHLPYPRKWRIIGLTKKRADELKFEWIKKEKGKEDKNMGQITVSGYFKAMYKRVLQYPHMPCLIVNNPGNYLPLEVCSLVENQHVRKKLTPTQTAKMIELTGKHGPRDRFQEIGKAVNTVLRESQPYLNHFEVGVGINPIELEGIKLRPPTLIIGGNRVADPKDGEWDFRNKRFYCPEEIKDWVVVNFCANLNMRERCVNDATANRLVADILRFGAERGMLGVRPATIANVTYVRGCLVNIFKRAKQTCPKLRMILFITPGDDDVYNEIKFVGDTQESVITQCINCLKAQKTSPSYIGNVLLKINAKLGGSANILAPRQQQPSKPAILEKSLMIVGADVSHPAPADKVSSSVASVVASIDKQYTQYSVVIKTQVKSREEIIKQLDTMMVDLLGDYFKKNSSYPEHIVFYRDGVSEGQFEAVLEGEILLLKKSFLKIRVGYNPKVTFVVVQKRHHTRFQPKDPRDGTGYHKNVPSGTLVDNTVTHKSDFDFFLCSQHGLQGTSRPSHYYVLWDDNKFNADDLQVMTFYLCHIYARASKSVSIPAPVFYSHLAAYRARLWIMASATGSDTESSVGEGLSDAEKVQREEVVIKNLNEKIRISDILRTRFFYC